MPKLRKTPQQLREIELKTAIDHGMHLNGIRNQTELAAVMGWSVAKACRLYRDAYQKMDFGEFCMLARRLKLTGRQLCQAAGVRYDDPE